MKERGAEAGHSRGDTGAAEFERLPTLVHVWHRSRQGRFTPPSMAILDPFLDNVARVPLCMLRLTIDLA